MSFLSHFYTTFFPFIFHENFLNISCEKNSNFDFSFVIWGHPVLEAEGKFSIWYVDSKDDLELLFILELNKRDKGIRNKKALSLFMMNYFDFIMLGV